jgi:hypothetical protein
MKDFAVDPHSNSFLTDGGRLRFTESRLEYLAQKVRCAISLFSGEWFLDGTLGVPYIPQSDNKAAHRPLLEAALQTKIAGVEGVRRLAEFTTDYDAGKRALAVSFVAETDAGDLVMNQTLPVAGGGV